MPGPFDDLIPANSSPSAVPGFIPGRPKAPTPLQQSAEQRAIEDQRFQREKFEFERQKGVLDMQKTQRDLLPGADTSESEKTAGFLATRVAGGIKELNRIGKNDASAMAPTFGVETVRGIFGDTAANYLTDADRQQAVAAQTDVLDAALTLGTGAAYTAEQLKGYRQAYFPQLGDDKDTVTAKQAKLRQLLESAKVKAGRAAPMIDEALAAAGIVMPENDGEDYKANFSPETEQILEQYVYSPKATPEGLMALHSRLGEGSRSITRDEAVALLEKFRGESPPDDSGPDLGQSLYAGVGDVAEGVGDMLGLVGNPLNAGINAVAGTNLSTDLGQTFRDATGAPQGDPLASAINKGGVSALTGLGAARLAQPVASGVTRTVTNALASQPVQQFAGGVSAGAGAETARQADAPVPVQVAAGLASGVTGFGGTNALMSLRQATARPSVPNALVADAERARVPLMTTDAVPPRTAVGKGLRKIGENIPIAGTGGQRVKQQEARVEAVKALARDFDVDDSSIADVAKDLSATRGNQIQLFTGQKKRILDNITTPVQAPRAIAMLDEQIAAATKVKTSGSQALVTKLTDFKKALQTGGNTLKELEAIRKEMGAAFKDPSLANIADAGQKAVRATYGPLRDDMAAAIKEAGGDEAAKTWRIANARLSSMADELQSTALKSTLNKADSTPEDVAKLLFSAKPSQVRLLFNNLSEAGREKARGALIAKALEKAGDDLSPDKFANELGRIGKNVGVFFQDADLARIEGLGRVLQATKRAGQAGVQPETGAQLTPWVAPTALTALFGIKGGVAAAGGYGLLARLYESAGVRNALLKLGRTKAGSPQEAKVMPSVVTALVAANENPKIQAYMQNAPGSSRAAASEDVGEERPIKP